MNKIQLDWLTYNSGCKYWSQFLDCVQFNFATYPVRSLTWNFMEWFNQPLHIINKLG